MFPIPLHDNRPAYTQPVVTIMLIVACVLVFFHETFSLEDFSLNYFVGRYAMVPAHFRPETLVTSMFLHAGWGHIIGNMLFLWAFGKSLEDAMGHVKFFTLYMLCGIAAGIVHVLFNFYSRTPTLGASGAIAGVMGAYLIKFPRAQMHTLVFIFFFITTADIPASLYVILWFVIQLFSGFGSITQTQVSDGGTAWFAHIGGFLAGMLLVNLLGTRNRYLRRQVNRW
jgi:membrane associated rhomboid family serine protease